MRRSATLLTATLLAASPGAQKEAPLAFVDVHVVPMDSERVLENQTVVLRGGRIVALGPSDAVEVPDDATHVDARGKYLLPGLAEMHGHIQVRNSFAPSRWPEDMLFLYLANGITTVRGMLGEPTHIELRKRTRSGRVKGPRVVVASPLFSGDTIASVADGERLVREAKRAGYNLIKIHEGLSVEIYQAIATTAREVGIPFGGHVPDDVGFFDAVRAGQVTIDHLDNMYDAVEGDPERIPELIEALRDNHAWVVPTEVLWETAIITHADPETIAEQRPELRYVPVGLIKRWTGALQQRRDAVTDEAPGQLRRTFRRKLLAEIAAAGPHILLGTDSPQIFSVPGFAVHREMAVMLESGMTPFQVLASGTTHVAQYLGEDDSGLVAVGHRADLILVDTNPLDGLECLQRPAGVVVTGRWIPREEIERRLDEIATAYAR